MTKALALISGGLDSILAAKIIQDMGIEVSGVYFKSPFYARGKKDNFSLDTLSRELLKNLNIGLKIVELGEEFLEIVRHPKHGYGKNINPCIDCKVLMLSRAKGIMQEIGAEFLVSGDVFGRHPIFQLDLASQKAGVEDLLLRPLSAKSLKPTMPEEKGWVARDKLFDFTSRSRQQLMELAVMLGVIDYPDVSADCLLTDSGFAKRLRDLMKFGKYDLANIALLKVGRHYRFQPGAKLVVGRNEGENAEIESLAQSGDFLFAPAQEIAGPSALGRGDFDESLISLAAGILARYCDIKDKTSLDISCRRLSEGQGYTVNTIPLLDEESKKYRL